MEFLSFLGRMKRNQAERCKFTIGKHHAIVPSGMTVQAGIPPWSPGGPSQPGAVRAYTVVVLWR